MKGQDFIARNIPDFLRIIQDINKTEEICWYRGHKDVRYKLIPNLYRDDELEKCDYDEMVVCSANTQKRTIPYKFKNDQQLAFSKFKQNGLAFVEQQPRNDFEWLVLMQHYEGKTQLLDWTNNPLISLYFALNSLQSSKDANRESDIYDKTMAEYIEDSTKNNKWINTYELGAMFNYSDFAVIYIINPLRINKINLKISNPNVIVTSEQKYQLELNKIINLRDSSYTCSYPICVEAPKFDRRAYIQGSGFTLHSHYVDGLDWFSNTKDYIYKIFIPNKQGIEIRSELRKVYGITHSFVFQDLINVVKDAYETY